MNLPPSGVDQIRALELRSSHEGRNSTPNFLPAAMLELQSARSNCQSIDRTLQAIATALGTACQADCCAIWAIDRWSGYPTQADFARLLAHPALSERDRRAIVQVDLPEASDWEICRCDRFWCCAFSLTIAPSVR
ncbi:MAG: hypothetical protein HC895_19315 [Leptolyngbyaceae cyanobacterium SM1_3_5]|nr:hypothetical protein [Leptolyngbyaceae cyanobacterium SM1_3_5]